MIKFFRNIRQRLLTENMTGKYLKYAIGEILLVMAGILLALQVNNWNESRKQDAQFKVTLEQLYNVLHVDVETFDRNQTFYKNQIGIINLLLEYPDSISDNKLPFRLFDLADDEIDEHNSDVPYYAKNLKLSPNNIEQNELSKQITFYTRGLNRKFSVGNKDISELFDELELPWPQFIDESIMNGINYNDSTLYTKNSIEKLIAFKNSDKYKIILKKLKFSHVLYNGVSFSRHKSAEALIQNIKTYYPNVKLIYSDVGIIGTSLDGFGDAGGRSTPMTLTDANNNIWETTLYLKKGVVKFRCHDSWIQDWGGDDFPKGDAIYKHGDIPVNEAGLYHILLNLSTNTYEFIKLADN